MTKIVKAGGKFALCLSELFGSTGWFDDISTDIYKCWITELS